MFMNMLEAVESCRGASGGTGSKDVDNAWSDGYSCALSDVKSAIANLTEENMCKCVSSENSARTESSDVWISVKDRMPESDADGYSDDVLIICESNDNGIVHRDVYIGYYEFSSHMWYTFMLGASKLVIEDIYSNVTHWKPVRCDKL